MIDLTLGGSAPAVANGAAQTGAFKEIAALPQIDARDIDGGRVESKEMAGRVVIVEFWATWCGPCRSTLGWLGEVKKRYGDRVEALAVAVESEEPETRKLIKSIERPPRVVMGTEELAASFGGIAGVPTMFVFDRQGRAATVFYGAPEDLHTKADQLLNSLLK
jgi:thiol-disulfide isomerase/thioredoxin